MAKRTSLAERQAKDTKASAGVDAFFPSESEPETNERLAPALEKKNIAPTSDQPIYIKASYYIRPDQDDNLLDIQKIVRRQLGERKDKSTLVREALDLLASKYGLEREILNQ